LKRVKFCLQSFVDFLPAVSLFCSHNIIYWWHRCSIIVSYSYWTMAAYSLVILLFKLLLWCFLPYYMINEFLIVSIIATLDTICIIITTNAVILLLLLQGLAKCLFEIIRSLLHTNDMSIMHSGGLIKIFYGILMIGSLRWGFLFPFLIIF